ncbi:unnamed protein product [Pelagomonas calceolata]|uniref:Uncharacterized protein n=2 Tax=Pelagomonas calceolata TaxID=35677 RepID=A0A8J2SA33_9STRA|nr:unnamed protein product [Pelagomonas calceolata]
MRHLRPLLLAACSSLLQHCAALSGAGRRLSKPAAQPPTLSRSRLLRAFGGAMITTLPLRADAVDCLGEAEKAQRLIRTTLAIYADDGDPAPLRPVAKTIAKPDSPLRQCLERAYYLPNDQLDETTRNHARDALEYAASVVEFDAFDRVWKTSQPKQSLTQYTAEGLQYSKRALEAVDRELGLFVFGCKVKGRSYFGVS